MLSATNSKEGSRTLLGNVELAEKALHDTRVSFVRIHGGNTSKIVFLCICIRYETENCSKISSICYARPPLNCKDQLCLRLQRRINSKNNFRLYLYLP